MKTVIVTGGAGFIGSALVRSLVAQGATRVVVVDKLTYAANQEALASAATSPRFVLEVHDICDAPEMRRLFREHRPAAVLHLAAESHVDRSIDAPSAFIQTNVVGTFTLLDVALDYWSALFPAEQERFRFLHVSTDEVFGSLGAQGAFHEEHPYRPNSPYSASKAASDHLVRAWFHTFGLPVLITNCTNNYGPFQFPEKLIPTIITKALQGEPIPVYGTGMNVRDWLFVDDHVDALRRVLAAGRPGQVYCIGGAAERTNLDVVRTVCGILDELAPARGRRPHEERIRLVPDRPGHDLRYAMDITRMERELGWRPRQSFESGMRATAEWYLENRPWWEAALTGAYGGQRQGTRRAADVHGQAQARQAGA